LAQGGEARGGLRRALKRRLEALLWILVDTRGQWPSALAQLCASPQRKRVRMFEGALARGVVRNRGQKWRDSFGPRAHEA